MKTYLLLRNNVEAGPFSEEEIKEKSLLATDLIWIEGESSKWDHPVEIQELEPLVVKEKIATANNKERKMVYISMPPSSKYYGNRSKENAEDKKGEGSILETRFSQSPDQIKSRYQENSIDKKPARIRSINRSRAMLIAAVFVGSVLSAMVMKKVIDDFSAFSEEENKGATAVAVIPPENYLTNKLPKAVTEVPIDEAKPETVKNIVLPKKGASKPLNNLVYVKTNDYKVGLFGGINKLSVTVSNKSNYTLDHVTLAVSYLKPNGQPVSFNSFVIDNIKPKSSKLIALPSSHRGVKIAYKVTSIQSKEHSRLLQI